MSERIGKHLKIILYGKKEWCVQTLQGDILGDVVWYQPWKTFVFQPETDSEYSADCLEDIAKFLKRLASPAVEGT